MSQVLGAFRLLGFTRYGPFSLGRHFETYETFISLVFQFLGGHSKQQISDTTANMGARLY
jgi:hypothetical protein